MSNKEKTPKDAAAVILIKDGAVFLAQRNPNTAFLGGWHAFPGGKLDPNDAKIAVVNCADDTLAPFIVCAVRETFEETGILLARGGDKMTVGQRASLLDDLMSARSTFAEILTHWGLWIDAADFLYTGFWTTPQFSPVRFKTRFFIAECPPKQRAAATAELVEGEFTNPQNALTRWRNGEILISPPVLIALCELTPNSAVGETNAARSPGSEMNLAVCAAELLEKSNAANGAIDFIELNSHIVCFPLATETLPPATHTNCFIVGAKEFVVIDAAAKSEIEQAKLHHFIRALIEKGGVCRTVITTHAHPDHTGGERALQRYLLENFKLEVPLAAHRLTAESLRGEVEFAETIEDGEVFELKDALGETFRLTALHAPGHAPGHLVFYDAEKGFLLAGDNVSSLSSIVIAPPDGDLRDYLATLEQLKNLSNLRFLCGSHGAAVYDARGKIESYIEHRLERERQILAASAGGAQTAAEIAAQVYPDLDPQLAPFAEKSVAAHLEKLKVENRI